MSHLTLRQSPYMIPPLHSPLFSVVYPKVLYLAHYFSFSIQLGDLKEFFKISFLCRWHPAVQLTPLSLKFSPGWTTPPSKTEILLIAQNKNLSNFLILQTYLSVMISSQSVPSSKLFKASSLGSFPPPLIVYPDFESCCSYTCFCIYVQPILIFWLHLTVSFDCWMMDDNDFLILIDFNWF